MDEKEILKKNDDLQLKVKSLNKKLKKTKRSLFSAMAAAAEEEDGEGNWLVAYADLMTLLFGFFVILSAFSTPNAEKVEQLRKQTSESLGGKYVTPYADLSSGLAKKLEEIDLEKEVSIIETEQGVTLTSRGALFFSSGSAELSPIAQSLMVNVAEVLAEQAQGFRLTVEGHTDNIPISSKLYPSNWELSAARASTVVRLLEDKGVSREDLRPMGLADTEPVSPNVDSNSNPIPENQAKNRRIVIKIIKKYPNRL
jgi:chemotaxis protein MotB